MKLAKLVVAMASVLAWGSAYAFHDGGVAQCDGCHVMHNANGGAAVQGKTKSNPGTNVGNSYLLQGTDQSSTCLLCHGGNGTNGSDYQIVTVDGSESNPAAAPLNYSPGGDFAWLAKSYTYTVGSSNYQYFWPGQGPTGTAVTSAGQRHGHNIIAADFAAFQAGDGAMTVAPGGSFPYVTTGKSAFACSNCHDPHGRTRVGGTAAAPVVISPLVGSGSFAAVTTGPGATIPPIRTTGSFGDAPGTANGVAYAVGTYRLLAGINYAPASNPNFPFQNAAPIAVAPLNYNKAEGASEVRVAYGTGMSEWCQNCHVNIHADNYVTGAPGYRHPAGSQAFLRPAQVAVYNSYVSSGDLSGSNRYSSLVPFESQVTDITKLAAAAQTNTPGSIDAGSVFLADTSKTVMCLSCHRAHASGWDSMVRWNMNASILTDSNQYWDTATNPEYANGRSAAVQQAAYYGRSVGTVGNSTNMGPFQRSMCNKCHGKD
jgi:hypothetical protein